MKVTILGAGAWGTSLAAMLAGDGHTITLWDAFPEHLHQIQTTARNDKFLPGIPLPATLRLEPSLLRAAAQPEALIVAVPSHVFRDVVHPLGAYHGLVISVTKGIEYETGLTMSGILQECLPRASAVALSGPTLAMEVARGIPTAIVAASDHLEHAQLAQRLFHRPSFRVYTSRDVRGVELGGALKNVIAIGAGICDGLGFGDNSKAALITRGIAEMRRLGVAAGALPETFAGLSGIGDLTVTCFSRLSRNRGFGERLGRGERVADILASMVSVAEGVPTSRSAHQLAQRLGITTPIIDQVHAMIHEAKPVPQAVQDLIAREHKAED